MNYESTIAGQQYRWGLLDKLGEGDAGEVYLVESLLEGRRAILKRPRKSSFSSDVLRQSAQIRTEGAILKVLQQAALPARDMRLVTPALLDQSPPDEGFSDRFFIVIEQASGFSLSSLQRAALRGQNSAPDPEGNDESGFFLSSIAGLRQIPEAILLRVLAGVIQMLETVHALEVWHEDVKYSGLIWNDVKPDHLYWDPLQARLMVIDWGNGDFLEADGVTKDRLHSRMDDYAQFMEAMGAFLVDSSLGLYARLEWPQDVSSANAYSGGVKPLKRKLASLLKEANRQARELRDQAARLHAESRPEMKHLQQSEMLQRQMVAVGEVPDFTGALNLHTRLALQLAAQGDLPAFQQVCERARGLGGAYMGKWELLGETAGIAASWSATDPKRASRSFAGALSAGVADDWPLMLWSLFELVGDGPLPDWWEGVSLGVRRAYLHLDQDALTPYVAVSRLFYTLQAAVLQGAGEDHRELPDQLHAREDILKIFNEEVVKKWKECEPAPPHSGVGYADIEGIIEDIELILPGTQGQLEKVFSQPKAHAELVLNAWERKDFETARQALRALLVWDPHRQRLLQAESAILSAPQWLGRVRNGAGKDEPFYDYLTQVELAGRNLRNRVGPAAWLDPALEALKKLRKGTRPADLMIERPEILTEIPWLNEYRSREILSLPRTRPLVLEREETSHAQPRTVSGTAEGRLGADGEMQMVEALDAWLPEARGSSARVFAGTLHARSKKARQYAIKVMRPDQVEYALPLFREEAQILSVLRDVPGITPMVECGFLRLDEGLELPSDESQLVPLRGQLVRYGAEEVQNFLASLEIQSAKGWLPYLVFVHRDQRYNLMKFCDAGYTHGWFLPLRESLLLTIQICDILQYAHDRNIVYRDHKILHYYWDVEAHSVAVIDWNISKRYAQGLSEAERLFDIAQFSARALHHILTGRPALGALPLGPNRPEEIEQASLSYPVKWTYDDERLPVRVKEIVEQALNQGYSQIKALRYDLAQVYQQIPEHANENSLQGDHR